MDVVQLVKDGQCRYEWYEVVSTHNGYKLHIKVLRDAMKFDDVPAMTWNLKPIAGDDRKFNGVRLPVTAHQLQEIADLLGSMLLTPKVIDIIWLQAKLKFDAVVNINGRIVATSNIHDVHNAIEKKIGKDDGTKLVSCVGKYWCLMNELASYGKLHGDWVSCNYGWFAKGASGPGITPGTKCWQRPGFRHNKRHWDPSQTIRLMHRKAMLVHPDGTKVSVDLHNIAADAKYAHLLHHQGALKYLRQKGVDKLEPLPEPDGIITIKPKKDFLERLLEILRLT
ncbi:MAG: hypothetical protein CMB80_16460 [Flammeovirgaceae bacterium]|nr:hypothetical protein [Flammeovirgaceae bacterium]